MQTIRRNVLETRTVRRNWHGVGREFEEQGQPTLNVQTRPVSRFISPQGSQECPSMDERSQQSIVQWIQTCYPKSLRKYIKAHTSETFQHLHLSSRCLAFTYLSKEPLDGSR
jgi:hypothetical protein